MPRKERDYKREYTLFHSKPKQKKRRAQRNKARAEMARKGRVRLGDGKDVDHKNNDTSKSGKNLRVQSKSTNRSFKRNRDSSVKK